MGDQVLEKKSRKLLYIAGGVFLLLVVVGVAAFAYDAWLTAETRDAGQRLEAPTADVLVKAVRLLDRDGGRGSD